jgi:hypothetical protein
MQNPLAQALSVTYPTEMKTGEKLLVKIESFMRRHGMPPSQFGHRVMNDKQFVFRLRLEGGGNPGARTIDKCESFMDNLDAANVALKKSSKPKSSRSLAMA